MSLASGLPSVAFSGLSEGLGGTSDFIFGAGLNASLTVKDLPRSTIVLHWTLALVCAILKE